MKDRNRATVGGEYQKQVRSGMLRFIGAIKMSATLPKDIQAKLKRLTREVNELFTECTERGKELKTFLGIIYAYDDLVTGAVETRRMVNIARKDVAEEPLTSEDLLSIETHLNNYIVLHGKMETAIAPYVERCTQKSPSQKEKA